MEMTAISPTTAVAPHPVMFLKRLLLTTVLLGAAGQLNSAAHAQIDQMASRRAINMARDTAIRLNGGLSMYRPGRCMFKTAKNNPCLVQSDASGFVFHFSGGRPGWQEMGLPASVDTVLRISADGRSVIQTIYNGPPANAP